MTRFRCNLTAKYVYKKYKAHVFFTLHFYIYYKLEVHVPVLKEPWAWSHYHISDTYILPYPRKHIKLVSFLLWNVDVILLEKQWTIATEKSSVTALFNIV